MSSSEKIWAVELEVEGCRLTFAEGACGASATDKPCYLTWATCRSSGTFEIEPKKYIFLQDSQNYPKDFIFYPTVRDVRLTPAKIVADNYLSLRATATITLFDSTDTDAGTDASISKRPTDRVGGEAKGTFWGKWLARNKYYHNKPLKMIFGDPQKMSAKMDHPDLVVKYYFIDSINLSSNGTVTINARDPLTDLKGKQAPRVAEVALARDITPQHSDLVLQSRRGKNVPLKLQEGEQQNIPADENSRLTIKADDGIFRSYTLDQIRIKAEDGVIHNLTDITVDGNFSIGGVRLRINDEIMDGNYLLEPDGVGGRRGIIRQLKRGIGGTEVGSHSMGDVAQLCFELRNATVAEALKILLVDYGQINPNFIDDQIDPDDEKSGSFITEQDKWFAGIQINQTITEPTDVEELIRDIGRQVGAYIWFDDETQKIKLRALATDPRTNKTITDDDIILDSLKVKEDKSKRLSQIWFHTNLLNLAENKDESKHYKDYRVIIDPGSESERKYGKSAIRDVYAKGVTANAITLASQARVLARLRDGEVIITMRITDTAAENINVGDVVRLNTDRIQNEDGEAEAGVYLVTAKNVNRSDYSIELLYAALSTLVVARYMPNSSTNTYSEATKLELESGGYIADNDGNLRGNPSEYKLL